MTFNQIFLFLTAFAVTQASASATPAQWAALNQTVDGRLSRGIPLAEPCYSLYNSTTVVPNLPECRAVQAGYTTDKYIASYYSGFQNVNWGACQKTAQGCPLDFDLPSNPTVYAPGKQCYQGSISPYYIAVQEVSDIQAALAFSNETGVALTIKNSGHDYKGRSSAPGSLALWTHTYQLAIKIEKNFIPDGCSAPIGDGVTFGAGQNFDGLYSFAEANNITIVGGSSPTVGPAGGWISGAGHSALSNTLGLGVDNVMQIRGVLPNGTYVTANECQNPDLWFAWRGGGGSTFGVNFEMTTRANPKLTLQVAYVRFESVDPNAITTFISLCIQNANKWASEGWGGYIEPGKITKQSSGFVLMTSLLNHTEAVASMKPITDYVASLGNIALNNEVDTVDGYYNVYENYLVPNDELVGLSTALGSRLILSSQFNGSDNQTALLTAITDISNMITFPTRGLNPLLLTYGAPLQFLVTAPSSYPVSAANDTSSITPAWREAVWHIFINVAFSNTASIYEIQTAFQTANSAADILRQLALNSGAYQNEADVFEPDPAGAFWGEDNYNRLLSIKQEIDPDNLLTCWDCIGWDATDERYGCYPSLT